MSGSNDMDRASAPDGDAVEDRLRRHLAWRAGSAELRFGVTDVATMADRSTSTMARALTVAAAALVSVGAAGGALWWRAASGSGNDPASGGDSPSAVVADSEPADRPVDERIERLAETGRLVDLRLFDGELPGPADEWLAPDAVTVEADLVGLVAAGPSSAEVEVDGAVARTDESRCVATLAVAACDRLLDLATGAPTTQTSSTGLGSVNLVDTGSGGPLVAWTNRGNGLRQLLIGGLPDEVALVELAYGDDGLAGRAADLPVFGQVPIEATATIPHPPGDATLVITAYDANAEVVWSTRFESWPLDPTDYQLAEYDPQAIEDIGYGGLVPDPARFGSLWTEFGATSTAGTSLAATGPQCPPGRAEAGQEGEDEEVLIVDGLHVGYGVDPSRDDVAVYIVRRAEPSLAAFYDVMRALRLCTVELADLAPPDLPGVIRAERFSIRDPLDQVADGIIVERDDLVLFVDVAVIDGIEPVDVDALVTEMLEAHDTLAGSS